MIRVEREVELRQTGGAGGPGSSYELRSMIRFPHEMLLPDWEIPLRALVLYRDADTQEWAIVASPSICPLWEERGSPPGGYFEFRSKGSWWAPVPLAETSHGRKTNLLVAYDGRELPAHVTLDDKKQHQSSGLSDEHELSIDLAPGVFKCAPYRTQQQQ